MLGGGSGLILECALSVIIVNGKGNAGGVVSGQNSGRFSRGSHNGTKE